MKKSALTIVLLAAVYFTGLGCFGQLHAGEASLGVPVLSGEVTCCDEGAAAHRLGMAAVSPLSSRGESGMVAGFAFAIGVLVVASGFSLHAAIRSRDRWYWRISTTWAKLFHYFTTLLSAGLLNPKIV